MKFEYYPDEIANALLRHTNMSKEEAIDDVTGALYDIKAICENRYNSEYWRTFWKVLEALTSCTESED